jgi:nicotinamidase-related amidase
MPSQALFVIDVQHELARDSAARVPHADRVCHNVDAVVTKARRYVDETKDSGGASDLLIVVVQHTETPEEGTLVKGSKEWELVFPPRDDCQEEILVEKSTRYIPFSNLSC